MGIGGSEKVEDESWKEESERSESNPKALVSRVCPVPLPILPSSPSAANKARRSRKSKKRVESHMMDALEVVENR